jgi:DNA repair protein RadD
MAMREYQSRGLDALRQEMLAGHTRIVFTAPTGSGKGEVISETTRLATGRGRRVLVTSCRRELVEDLSERLTRYQVPHGLILAGAPTAPHFPVQVASIATLARRDKPPADVVLVDEVHHATAESWSRIIDAYPDAVIVGFTATPIRLSGRPLGDLFQALVVAATPAELVELGNLVPVDGFAYDTPDLKGIKRVRGDYDQSAIAAKMGGTRIVGNVVDSYLAHARGLRNITFGVNCQHSRQLAAEYCARGVPAEHVDGEMPREERAAILRRYRAGETLVLCNVMLCTEGFDLPEIGCVTLVRPTKSLALFLQMVGRGRRPVRCACGLFPHWRDATCSCGREVVKRVLKLHDHAGCVLDPDLGLPDDPREWSLTEGLAKRPGPKAPGVRVCKACFALYPPTLPACPLCRTSNPKRVRMVKTVDGREITLEQLRKERAEAKRKAPLVGPPSKRELEYRNLVLEGHMKGRKPTWAKMAFNARFHHFPPKGWDERAREALPPPPTDPQSSLTIPIRVEGDHAA